MVELEVRRRKIVGNIIKRIITKLRNDLEDLSGKIYGKIANAFRPPISGS